MTPADSSHIDLRITISPVNFVVILTKELIHRRDKGKQALSKGSRIAGFATEMQHDAAHHEKGAAAVRATRAFLNRMGSRSYFGEITISI
jgi:hypothetical protein